jgi:hypothetical protein
MSPVATPSAALSGVAVGTAYLVSSVEGVYLRRVARQEQFVYHQLASDFRGTVLLPLNHLATVYPDIYAREAQKYAGREGVMSYRVPHLLNVAVDDDDWGGRPH